MTDTTGDTNANQDGTVAVEATAAPEENPTGSPAAEPATVAADTATSPVTPTTDSTGALAVDANAIRKDIENEAHPLIKSKWQEFEGDMSKLWAWMENEVAKII